MNPQPNDGQSEQQTIRKIQDSVPGTNAVKRWKQIVQQALPHSISPAGYRQLWDWCFENQDFESNHLKPIWIPDDSQVAESNVGKWLASIGVPDYRAFHHWTVQHREEFWAQAIDRLGIPFKTRPGEILDQSQGVTKTAWLPGARVNIVDACFQQDDDRTAILAQKPGGRIREWSYHDLQRRAARVANSLVDAGFKIGDSLAVVMPMTDWSIAIYLGVIMAGCNIVSIADSFAPPEIATRLNIAGAKAVFTYDYQNRAGKQLPLYRRVAEASSIPAVVLATDGVLSVDIRDQDLDWAEFLVDRTEFESVTCHVQETINILFSSGTTGDPKAIPWSHLTPIKCAIDGFCHQNIQPGDVCAWPTNLGWMMGPWLIFASLINGATIAIFEDAPMGTSFGKFVQDAGVTMLGVVPTIVKAWQESRCMESCDWSKIKVFSSTGESSQIDAMFYLSSLAKIKPIIEYCGGTEIGGGYVSSVVALPNFPAAFNTPAVGLDFVLVENEPPATAHPALADAGEVFLVPPSIGLSSRLVNRDHFQTYFANTPEISGLGPLRRHGDYFRCVETEFGRIFIAQGRADDTMNLGGIKVSSAEVERVLNRISGVTETAALASAPESGPAKLIVYATTDSSVEPDELLNTMNQRLKRELNPLFKIDSLKIIDVMPRTASGKLMRRTLRDC